VEAERSESDRGGDQRLEGRDGGELEVTRNIVMKGNSPTSGPPISWNERGWCSNAYFRIVSSNGGTPSSIAIVLGRAVAGGARVVRWRR
jgi:hypothetical protein